MKHDVALMNKSFPTPKLNGCLNCVQTVILSFLLKAKENPIIWHQSAGGEFHYLAACIETFTAFRAAVHTRLPWK